MEFTSPSAANRSYDWLRLCSWEATDHRPYSTDVAPSYFLLFGHLKKHLACKRFAADADMKQVVSSTEYRHLTSISSTPACEPWCHGGMKLTSECQRWLHGSLMCTICYPFALCRLHRCQNKFIGIRVCVKLLLEVYFTFLTSGTHTHV